MCYFVTIWLCVAGSANGAGCNNAQAALGFAAVRPILIQGEDLTVYTWNLFVVFFHSRISRIRIGLVGAVPKMERRPVSSHRSSVRRIRSKSRIRL